MSAPALASPGLLALRVAPPRARRTQRCASSRRVFAVGGRPGGGLILPGSEGFPGGGGGGGGGGVGPRPGGFGPSASAPPRDGPLYQPFRPPAAYSDTAELGRQDLLNKLQTRAARWFELAKVVDALHAGGMQNTEIFEVTGLTQLTQNAWKVQAAVYFSLAELGDFPKELLSYYHSEDKAATLTELRSVSAEWRPAAARFVAERQLDVGGARELTRAIVDVERRREPGFSFDHTPGDALAAKVWRDAGEVPYRGGWQEAVAKHVERGLGVATSERAKAKLRARLEETGAVAAGGAGGAPVEGATLQVFRLESEEAAFRPLPLLGFLDDVTPQAVKLAPRASPEGVFNAFKPPAGGSTWVALPAWAKLQPLTAAVAIQVVDTRSLKAVPTLCSFGGPCLLVVDREALQPQNKHYYLVSRASSLLLDAGGRAGALQRLEVVPGAQASDKGVTVCGQLVLACRPPLPPGAPKEMPEGIQDLGVANEEEDGMDVSFPEDE